MPSSRRKALALISGGLDSILAAEVVRRQGIETIGLHMYTGFCITESKRRINLTAARNPALKAASERNLPVEMLDISKGYLDIVLAPRHGYGANANPCIDCRIFMLRRAAEFGAARGIDFYVTGEVLGQRPMSQRRGPMDLITRRSGIGDILLRPLSAKLLPPTLPEREGWVDRELLHDMQGRTRKPQMALASELGIADYAQPAGGCCFLTDETYSRRFFETIRARSSDDLPGAIAEEEILLLGVGRHFRLPDGARLVVGRNEGENAFLSRRTDGLSIRLMDLPGPAGHLSGAGGGPEGVSPRDLHLAGSIIARYSRQAREIGASLRIVIVNPDNGEEDGIEVSPIDPREIDGYRIT